VVCRAVLKVKAEGSKCWYSHLPNSTGWCLIYDMTGCKELGMLKLNVKQNYIYFYYKEFTTTTSCFGPICGPSSGYISMRVRMLI